MENREHKVKLVPGDIYRFEVYGLIQFVESKYNVFIFKFLGVGNVREPSYHDAQNKTFVINDNSLCHDEYYFKVTELTPEEQASMKILYGN